MGTYIPKPSPPSPNGSTTDPNGDGWRMEGHRAGKTKAVWKRVGIVWRSNWWSRDGLGALYGRSWGPLGRSWDDLGRSWYVLGAILEATIVVFRLFYRGFVNIKFFVNGSGVVYGNYGVKVVYGNDGVN